MAEFADDEKGISSLADKYKTKIDNLPIPNKSKAPKPPADKGTQEPLLGGHKVVYEDTSFNKSEESSKKPQKYKEEQKLSESHSRVVYDADAEQGQSTINENDFKSFDEISPTKTQAKKSRSKSRSFGKPKKDENISSLNKTGKNKNDDFYGKGEGFNQDEGGFYDKGEGFNQDEGGFYDTGEGFSQDEGGFYDISEELSQNTDTYEDLAGQTSGPYNDGKELSVLSPKTKKGGSRFAEIVFSFIPKKGDSKGEAFRKLLMTFSLIVMFCAGIYLIAHFFDKEPVIPPVIDDIPTDAEGNYIDPRLEYPDIDFPEGLLDRFVDYYAINQDFVGQIIIGGKDREAVYPVVQEKDKASGADDFYLKHSFFKEPTRYGTPFLDYRNDADAKDKNTILHGHNMMDGLQFAVIEDYINDYDNPNGFETLKKNPIITYWTRYEEIHYKIYAVMITNGRAKDDNGYIFAYHTPRFKNEEAFLGYKKMLDMRKLYTTGVDLNYDDQVITISTCGYAFKDAWYVLVARRVRENESLEIDESKIVKNESPWYPQSWYDSKGKKNPYINETRWDG